ncbi:MAG: RHS repeat-associated core domain-containing protein [Verrucomicrobiales bacterium]
MNSIVSKTLITLLLLTLPLLNIEGAVTNPPFPGPSEIILTNPPPGLVPQMLSFSPEPTEQEISSAKVFAEPLVAIWGQPTTAENKALAECLLSFSKREVWDDFSAVENFLNMPVAYNWYASVLYSLGWEYYQTGYYSKAIDAWEEVWLWTEFERTGRGKVLADRTVGELAKMHARIGGFERLETLFKEIGNRTINNGASEKIAGAKQAYWLMINKPEIAFRCGPLALYTIRRYIDSSPEALRVFMQSASTQKGVSLKKLTEIAKGAQFDSQMAKRPDGADFVVPSVVHWKVGHYAAVLKREHDRYWVIDPTFGDEGMWVSQKALENESSGYFVIPGKQVPPGWKAVSDEEGDQIHGKGVTASSNPNQTTPGDAKQNPDCRVGSAGMATYNFHLMLVSLNIEDTPLSFKPPRGDPIEFIVTYNHREANQPTVFNYSNIGQKWTCNWISYLTDNGPSIVGDVQYYVPGGGTETFTGYNTNTAKFNVHPRIQSVLTRTSTNSYELLLPDGARRIFGQPDGSVGTTRKVFLTQVIDALGYTNLVLYDSQLRLSMVTDPGASKTNLVFEYDSNDLAFNKNTIRRVRDRYGRTATLNYDLTGGQLESIDDVLNLRSEFFYTGGFINTLKTPYGETKFSFGEDGRTRWLEAVDPLGQKARAEYTEDPTTVPNADPGPEVPLGIYRRNSILNARNTFYWDKKAMHEAAGDYSKARVYHWQHGPNWASAVGTLESYKEPLESRIWFNYPGQISSDEGATLEGTIHLPSRIARVLDDGQTQLWRSYRDSYGNITNNIDPIGRSFSYVYATNGIDLLEARATTGTNNQLIAAFTYNSQHLPLTSTDASGQTTKYVYNSYGQLTFITNALAEVTALSYDNSGRLEKIDGPLPGTNDYTGFTYDEFDRIRTFKDSDSYTITVDYDAFDRVLTNSFPDGTKEVFAYKNLERETFKDRAGRITKTVFNAVRQLIEIQDGSTNQVTYIDYCDCGNMSRVVDPEGRSTQWLYDVQGRVITKSTPSGYSVSYTYENNTSRLKNFKNERGQIRTYAWNRDDSLAWIYYADTNATPNAQFLYDPVFPRLSAYGTINSGTYLTYNPITSSPTLGAGRLASVDGPLLSNDTVTLSYDALGRVVGEMMVNTDVNAHSLSNKFGFDALGRLTAVTNKLGVFTYTYAGASDRLDSITAPNGLATTYGYYGTNGDLRLKEITNKVSTTQLSRFSYAYNTAGQISNWVQQVSTGTPKEYQIAYDFLNQLTNISVIVGGATTATFQYSYDRSGNRLLEKNGASTWNAYYNTRNELIGKDTGLTVNNRSFEWDEENRLRTIIQGTTRYTFVYDANSELLQLNTYNGTNLTYSKYFTWYNNQIVQEVDYDSTLGYNTAKWFVPQGFTAYDAGWAPNPSKSFTYTTDHLGSIRESLNNGVLDARYDYDPFGRRSTLQVSGAGRNPDFGFTGLYTANSLNLALFRTYDPDLGRWLSRDPIGEVGGLNLYAYAFNDPINLTDLDVLCPSGGPRNSLGGGGSGGGGGPPVANAAPGGSMGPGGGNFNPGQILHMQRNLSHIVNRQGEVANQWLASSPNRWAQLYRSLNPDSGFAKGIRGRILDERTRKIFRRMFGSSGNNGIGINQTVPGSGSTLRPDLYFPNLGGRSVIFDVGSRGKVLDIGKYSHLADEVIPLIPIPFL